jgi:hypothetical protein
MFIALSPGEHRGMMTLLPWVLPYRAQVPIVSTGSVQPMGELFKADGTPNEDCPGAACDNVLLEWTAALELLARKHVKAVMPVIACDETGTGFSWGLSKSLSVHPHDGTIESVKKHLRNHTSRDEIVPGAHVLDGVREMVTDVMNDPKSAVSVAGAIASVMRAGVQLTPLRRRRCREHHPALSGHYSYQSQRPEGVHRSNCGQSVGNFGPYWRK